MTILLAAEDFIYELDNSIVLPGLCQTSCFCLESSRCRVLVRHLPGQRIVPLRSFQLFAQIFEPAGFLPFRFEVAEIAVYRGRRVWVADVSLLVEDNNAIHAPQLHAFGEGSRCGS